MFNIKKFFSLFFVVFNVSNVYCQTYSLHNFTVTDIHGYNHTLFNYLDSNKFVLIDFFNTSCGPCQTTAVQVQQSYEDFGCNTGNVIFLGIDRNDNNSEVEAFDSSLGVNYPTISGEEGGGNAVMDSFGILGVPVLLLISPSHQIVKNIAVLTTEHIDTVVHACGGLFQPCFTKIDDQDFLSNINIYPNPAKKELNINIGNFNCFCFVEIIDNLGRKIKKIEVNNNTIKIDISFLNSGFYYLYIRDNTNNLNIRKLIIQE